MEKVMVTKEQEQAIKCIGNKATYVQEFVLRKFEGKEISPFESASIDQLIRALYIGYEVEETPEDRIREIYTKQSPTHPEGHPGYYKQLEVCKAFQEGIHFTLNTLNIKIEGVNA